MRWHTTADDAPALFGAEDLLVPELGTGRMSGLEFLHVTAKRILNHVPPGSRAPFPWTINVYRGCSHACSYCLGGDTPILLADGRITPIRDLRVGDRVYGTTVDGRYRRYTPTDVLAHWTTTKRAWRVTLADGTELIASGDHRFLTAQRGWKHVAPADRPAQRAHLTPNNSLLGIGRLATPPKESEGYRHGYLTGMVRGDANLATYWYDRPGRSRSAVHRFRLALTDLEPLERTESYLGAVGIRTTRFAFSEATANRRPMTAIRTSRGADIASIRRLIAWPDEPGPEWQRGFLAGIFDAEGSHSHGILRISNADPAILARIVEAALFFDFRPVVEPPRPGGVRAVRLLGGLRERLRFLLLTDPATTRKRTIDDVAIKSDADLRVIAVDDLGIEVPMYDITTGTGDFVADGVVSHNCFARPTHEYLGLNLGEDFDKRIVVKINAPDKLRQELADPAWTGEPVAMGTNTDPYQRAEAKYRLTRGVLEALAERGNPFSILTKSPLVTRDLDVLLAANERAAVSVNFSVATLDEQVWRASEPGTPHPRRRIEAMRTLADAGIRTGALVAPVLPGLSDSADQLRQVLHAVDDAGGRFLGIGALYLRPGVREHFLAWLRDAYPDHVGDYERRYANGAYPPERYFDMLYRRAGVERPPGGIFRND